MVYVNLNGDIYPSQGAGAPMASRAFRYGYGLFETMLIQDARIRLEDYHWQRLKEGMECLLIAAAPHFFKELAAALSTTVRRNGHEKLCRARVQVWPGAGSLYDDDRFNAQFCVETYPLESSLGQLNENGLVLGVAEGIVKTADAFSHIKSCSALPYALGARQVKAKQWNDAVLLNQHGRIADSTIANFFWIKNGLVFTPPLSEGCVAGVLRRYLLERLPEWGYQVEEQSISPDEMDHTTDIFLTNAVRGIRWVSHFNTVSLSNRNAIAELQEKMLRSLME